MKVLVDYNNILKISNECHKLSGTQGFCYVKDDYIHKFYWLSKSEKRLTDLSGYRSSIIAFPLCYYGDIKKESKIVGEKMEYFPKKNIYYSINMMTEVRTLINHIKEVLREIERFPEIKMHDLTSPNILYDDLSGFSIIDTTRWSLRKYNCVTRNKNDILMEIKEAVFNVLNLACYAIDNICFRNNLLKYGAAGRELLNLLALNLDDDVHLLEFLELYLLLFEKEFKDTMVTLNDMEEHIIELKKM